VSLAADVIEGIVAMIRSREIDKAVHAVNAAQAEASTRSLVARQEAVNQANVALFQAKRQKERLLAEIERLPERERFDAEQRLLPTIDALFNDEIARLRTQKRGMGRA